MFETRLPLASVKRTKPPGFEATVAPLIGAPELQEVTLTEIVPFGAFVQLGNLKLPMRVLHLKGLLVPVPLFTESRYSWVYQNVQSSTGSDTMLL
jgi:hypothetical protein